MRYTKQVVIQDNPRWREELEALFKAAAFEKETELDKGRKISKSIRSKDRKSSKEGNG